MRWIKVEEQKFTGGIEKFLEPEVQQKLRDQTRAQAGDLLLFVADTEEIVCQALGQSAGGHLATTLKLYDPAGLDYKMTWVYDFPSFHLGADRTTSVAQAAQPPSLHGMEVDEELAKLESDPGSVRARACDLVVNGYGSAAAAPSVFTTRKCSRACSPSWG